MENALVVLKKKSLISKIVDLVLYTITAISIILLILSLIIITKKALYPTKVPDIFGIKPFVVLSGSMEPTIQTGDLAIIKSVEPDQLKVGDIIAFRYTDEDIITLHRISEIDKVNNNVIFRTKGDNNKTEDKLNVQIENIEGIYSGKLDKIGNVVMSIKTPQGLALSLLTVVLIFLIWQFFKIKKKERILNKRLKESIEIIHELKKGEIKYV